MCVRVHACMCVLYAQVYAQVHLPMYGWGDQRMMLGPALSLLYSLEKTSLTETGGQQAPVILLFLPFTALGLTGRCVGNSDILCS